MSCQFCNTVEAAALLGHFDCLIYLHTHGCSLHYKATFYASLYGHLDCLKYLLDNGCDYDKYIWHTDNIQILLYLYYKNIDHMPDDKSIKFELVQQYISGWDTLVDAAKIDRRYIPADIWNIIRAMYL